MELYHTKEYKGTTTIDEYMANAPKLYHTKEYKGTTTAGTRKQCSNDYIIPKNIRELQP